jgi:vancomycin resistance protein VanJ
VSAAAAVATASVATIALVEWALAILRPEGGPLGVLQIVAPHMALVGLVFVPLALLGRRRGGVVATVALVAVSTIRFGGMWFSAPPAGPAAGALRIDVATWNLEVESRPGAATTAFLEATTADIVGLQELQPDAAAAIDADPVLRTRFPYRELHPRDDVVGLGLLSRYPISNATFGLGPAIQEATLDLGSGRTVAVLNVHPLHADIATLGGTRLPIGLDVDQRNADLVAIRARVDTRIAAGRPVLLLGDMNTADSEPAFDRLAAGLRDVHAEVGEGTGWSWRPIRLEFLGLGLLRIDHVIASPAWQPVSIADICPPVGDHCLPMLSVPIVDSVMSTSLVLPQPPAARCTARIIRKCVPQRHRFAASSCRI